MLIRGLVKFLIIAYNAESKEVRRINGRTTQKSTQQPFSKFSIRRPKRLVMKKIVISGSSKLTEQVAYWRGYFEGRGYEVLDYPKLVPEGDYAVEMTKIYRRFYRHLDNTNVFFLMNEDQNDIPGYIGASSMSELSYVVMNNLNHDKKVEVFILQEPSDQQSHQSEVKFWLEQGWIKIYEKPTGKKGSGIISSPNLVKTSPKSDTPSTTIPTPKSDNIDPLKTIPNIPANISSNTTKLPPANPVQKLLRKNNTNLDKSLDITTCRKKCLRSLTVEAREYLRILCPDFPTWLLKYISVPEFQRLSKVSMTTMDYGSLYQFPDFNSVFTHSIGVALIVWKFTHDQKQTIAGLYHDIASPAFKHAIDYMNNDAETQESTEANTSEIIRGSKSIMRLLHKDSILASEISDYHLYPIADNNAPGLAADRLEYTLSNGLFLYETWDLAQVRYFYDNITILKNEDGITELGFADQDVCEEFINLSLPTFEAYRSDNARASLQFIGDIIHSMIVKEYLSLDDLYSMSEREIIDWILSCGDKTIGEAFRQYQRATATYASSTIKKDRYCTDVKTKNRYINPLVKGKDEEEDARISELSSSIARTIKKFLDFKPSKYVGFDFEFTPYNES